MAEETDKPPADSGTLTGEQTPVMDQNSSQEDLSNSELIGGRLTRDELVELLKKSGLPWARSGRHSYHSTCVSEPSSPSKMNTVLRKQTTLGSSSGSSSSTLTSEDQDAERGDNVMELRDSPAVFRKLVSSAVMSQEQNMVEEWEYELPPRSGSLFYHESFAPPRQMTKPILFIPSAGGSKTNTIKSVDIMPLNKRDRGIFNRLRRSLRGSKAKQKPVIRTLSDRAFRGAGSKKWIDSEEELDAVSKPSYFRHIAHLVHHGPGLIRVVEIHKPPNGKYGIYIVQGCSDTDSEKKSVFISRFYEETLAKFYAGLLSPGDEILAVNGLPVRDKPVQEVQKMFSYAEMVRLTVLPRPLTN